MTLLKLWLFGVLVSIDIIWRHLSKEALVTSRILWRFRQVFVTFSEHINFRSNIQIFKTSIILINQNILYSECFKDDLFLNLLYKQFWFFFFTQTQYTHLQKSQTRGTVCGDDKMTMTKAPITWHEYLCHNSFVLLPTQHKLVCFHKFLSKICKKRIGGLVVKTVKANAKQNLAADLYDQMQTAIFLYVKYLSLHWV